LTIPSNIPSTLYSFFIPNKARCGDVKFTKEISKKGVEINKGRRIIYWVLKKIV